MALGAMTVRCPMRTQSARLCDFAIVRGNRKMFRRFGWARHQPGATQEPAQHMTAARASADCVQGLELHPARPAPEYDGGDVFHLRHRLRRQVDPQPVAPVCLGAACKRHAGRFVGNQRRGVVQADARRGHPAEPGGQLGGETGDALTFNPCRSMGVRRGCGTSKVGSNTITPLRAGSGRCARRAS